MMQEPMEPVIIHTFGLDQLEVVQKLGELIDADRPISVTTNLVDGIVAVDIRPRPGGRVCTSDQLNQAVLQAQSRLGPIAYGCGLQSLPQSLVILLRKQCRTLVTAESCTGGLVSKRITDVPGASRSYLGGWVVYSNQLKVGQLGVCMQMIQEHGAVSQAVARALAQGAVHRSGADLSVAITGVAGPDGGTIDKPVGTVWIGLAARGTDSPNQVSTEAWKCHLGGDRVQVRDLAAKCAMQLLRFALLGESTQVLSIVSRVSGVEST